MPTIVGELNGVEHQGWVVTATDYHDQWTYVNGVFDLGYESASAFATI